jgi:diguanylate cyclase (GGDEF)-like protein
MLPHIARVLRLTQFLALLLVVSLGAALYGVLADFREAGHWVEHTHEVIDDLGQVRAETMRTALWLRNDLSAPDKAALEQAHTAAARAQQVATRLVELTADNPAQNQRLQALEVELSKVLGAELDAALRAQREGPAVRRPPVTASAASPTTRELHGLLDQAEQVERALLHSRSQLENERLALLQRLLAGGGLLFAGFMGWAIKYSARLLRVGHEEAHQLKTEAQHDPLTGLLNRRGLQAQLSALAREPRGQGHSVAVLAFDLDDFKPINDRYGHAAGDEVLQEVARRLQQQCRGGDLVARPGGDEFIVVLRSMATGLDAETVAQRIRTRLMTPLPLGTAVLRMGTSIGIAMLHEDGDTLEALLQVADERLIAAKQAARKQVHSGTQILELVGD